LKNNNFNSKKKRELLCIGNAEKKIVTVRSLNKIELFGNPFDVISSLGYR